MAASCCWRAATGNIGVGADGAIARHGNQLVRTRAAYAARGFAVLVPDCCVDVAAAVQYMQAIRARDAGGHQPRHATRGARHRRRARVRRGWC